VTKRERFRERIRRRRALNAERREAKRKEKEREETAATREIPIPRGGLRPSATLDEANWPMPSDARNLEKQRQRAIDALERDVEELSRLSAPTDENAAELARIRDEVGELKREFYTNLGPWQKLLIARHPQRPYTDDFIRLLFENFSEIHGDRGFADDAALITGIARFHGKPVMIVGSQKGRDTKQRLVRNFGQAKPEGYHHYGRRRIGRRPGRCGRRSRAHA
jgi:hypothetical protein